MKNLERATFLLGLKYLIRFLTFLQTLIMFFLLNSCLKFVSTLKNQSMRCSLKIFVYKGTNTGICKSRHFIIRAEFLMPWQYVSNLHYFLSKLAYLCITFLIHRYFWDIVYIVHINKKHAYRTKEVTNIFLFSKNRHVYMMATRIFWIKHEKNLLHQSG